MLYITTNALSITFITMPPKSISEKEQEVLKFWEDNHIFEKSVNMPAGEQARGNFSFYDGPPFATGLPHYGHILAGTIKDAVPRYQTMKGNSVRRVWGWDCHGLPIENLIEKKLGLASKKDIEDFGIDKFNNDAYQSVLQYEEEWKGIVPRLGRWIDMEKPYKTMDASYTESIWWAWKSLYEKKLAYEGNKMMHICPRCETTLAQSEVGMEYHDVTDISVTAKFELKDEPETFVLAWTTTPWTLPGNTALAINIAIPYVKVRATKNDGVIEFYILAEAKFADYKVYAEKDFSNFEIVEQLQGSELVGKTYKPVFPYFENADIENKEHIWKVWHADFITADTGTGIAHEAPAFGAEDMELAKAHKIPIIKHVKMDGTFTSSVTDFAGMKVKVKDDTQSADIEIIKWLAHNGKLFEKHKIIHSYPLCWRCKTPLLNYATSSWFVDVPKIKEKLLSENKQIGWTPSHTRDGRFGKWLEGAREWAVSRSRYWGAPLPVWKNSDGSEVKVIGSLKELAEANMVKPKNTYFAMRHGESVFNTLNKLDSLGNKDNVLTKKGVGQIKEAISKLKDLKVDVIISSPLPRTIESAEILSEALGIKYEVDENLREFNFGEYENVSASEFHEMKDIHENPYKRVPGGESFKDGAYRFMKVVGACEENYTNKKILLVTHGSHVYMGTREAELVTDEMMIHGGKDGHTINVKNGDVVSFTPHCVPRDETGAVNLHRPYIDQIEMIDSKGNPMKRIGDVFDCWFESGSMPFASIHYPFENKEVFDKNYPAQFIAEGMDQTRGWFYSLINLGVGLFDKAPYEHVIVNGLVLASSGVKLSKSEKNYTDPMELVEKYGADAMRYALLSSPVVKGENLQFDDENISDVYKKCISRLENVVTLYEMNKEDEVQASTSSTNILDRWMVARMHELVESSTRGYDQYLLDDATRGIGDIIDDISVWYTRRSRERLKGDEGEDAKREAYQTLTYTLLTLAKIMAPVMPFIAERVYKAVGGEKESVHLDSWPTESAIDTDLITDMKLVRELVSLGLMKRTESKINVKQPLLSVTFNRALDEKYFGLIIDELNVKEVKIDETSIVDVILNTTITEELQKEGDMRKLMRAIQDARKEKGLSPSDSVTLIVSSLTLLSDDTQLRATCKISSIKEDVSIVSNPTDFSQHTLYFGIE